MILSRIRTRDANKWHVRRINGAAFYFMPLVRNPADHKVYGYTSNDYLGELRFEAPEEQKTAQWYPFIWPSKEIKKVKPKKKGGRGLAPVVKIPAPRELEPQTNSREVVS